MKTVLEVAKELAEAHKREDPSTKDIYLAEATDEVRLVEITESLGSGMPREVLPFRFTPRPDLGVFYPSVIVLLNQDEWDAVQSGRLQLPSGWDKNSLKKVG